MSARKLPARTSAQHTVQCSLFSRPIDRVGGERSFVAESRRFVESEAHTHFEIRAFEVCHLVQPDSAHTATQLPGELPGELPDNVVLPSYPENYPLAGG